MTVIDINIDAGESYGAWSIGDDAGTFPHATSVNLACGFHGGDPASMFAAARLALEYGLAIGAHPGLPDLVGFGRRRLDVTPDQAYNDVVYQVGERSDDAITLVAVIPPQPGWPVALATGIRYAVDGAGLTVTHTVRTGYAPATSRASSRSRCSRSSGSTMSKSRRA